MSFEYRSRPCHYMEERDQWATRYNGAYYNYLYRIEEGEEKTPPTGMRSAVPLGGLEPSHNGEKVFFEQGTVSIQHGKMEITGNDGSLSTKELEKGNDYELMWSRLYDAYRTGEGCAFTAEDGAEVMKVYDALSLSLQEKRSVVL